MKTLLFITTLLVSFSASADHQGDTKDYAKQQKLPQQKEQDQQHTQMQQLENQRMIKELEQRRQEIEQQLSQQPK